VSLNYKTYGLEAHAFYPNFVPCYHHHYYFKIIDGIFLNNYLSLYIILKSSPAWQVDPELKLGRIEEKTGEEKTRCNQIDRVTRSKIRLQPIDIFFTKMTLF